MKSIQDTIIQSIGARKKGAVLFIDAFEKFGSSEAVRQAFSRLQKSGFIIRLAKGIYLYLFDKENLRVSMEQIAKEVAARDKAHILPTGTYAQHRLGLSTQIQTNWVYITDGTPRTLKISGNTIKFKKGVAKNFRIYFDLPRDIIADMLNISVPTLYRWTKSNKNLERNYSIKLFEIADLFLYGIEVFEKMVKTSKYCFRRIRAFRTNRNS